MTHFNGVHLLALIIAGLLLYVIYALARTERVELHRDCDTIGCHAHATEALERHTGQVTWRCREHADEMYRVGWGR